MRGIESHSHTINTEVVQWFFLKKKQNILHTYSVSSYIMRGLGYMDKKTWISKVTDFCDISEKTCYRWLELAKKSQLLVEKNGVIYIKGKKKLKIELDIYSKNAISLEPKQLKNKKEYKRILVEQLGLLFQRRYRYAHKEIVRYGNGSNLKGGIESRSGIAFKKHDVGCSLSYLSKKTGLSKTQVARCLTSRRKVSNVVAVLTVKEFKQVYTNAYFKTNHKMFYVYSKGKYTIREKLPSVIDSFSLFKRSGL